ncbi:DISARM system phospholipase D-like protein DrmC [Nannocystis radixulma]|uniref:DISARM system phospholipase D-like protein DrmC n=1 Tax=Nannocystis radixulma TaxID=2995305 RepID=A0ABT5BJT3_9BACT|nr:DISARM system phospholipase D-like protein DrmC [Nannocystis radixulma]MDC0674416.1 DISARM system phospholipase D-like protein DrmC [Nannocystis radixulma]
MLPGLAATALEDLASVLEAGRLRAPFTRGAARRHVPETILDEVVHELNALHTQGFTAPQTALLLRTLARERRHRQHAAERVELVWSGPEVPGTSPRDTAVVVRTLCSAARRSVLIANFAFDRARDGEALARARALWQPLADAMDARPELSVRIFANVERKDSPDLPDSDPSLWVNRFRSHFTNYLWPGTRLPELYYDPRSLASEPGERAILHAKCIVVDDTRVFLTSANFTQAGQHRNLEAGLLLEDPALARDLTAQFDALLQQSWLLPIHATARLGRIRGPNRSQDLGN